MDGGFASIPQMIAAAQATLGQEVRDHIEGAAGTKATLKRNRLGLDCLAFRPRVLRDVSEIDTGTTLLGYSLRIPVVIAPIGSLHTITPLGAVDAVRAAGAFGVVGFTSSVADPRLRRSWRRARIPRCSNSISAATRLTSRRWSTASRRRATPASR